ncbi:MAG: polysaccharide deacetylase family protein [Candidatus Thermoplasmatota archaeon]|nr:polysaccharide deacetylase family protein [Candidatus Thermoplasmatota archaeon]MCL5989661.1 polysaccharide deacetylase family protein [Candidatus Thermoplasmatota archaeon]
MVYQRDFVGYGANWPEFKWKDSRKMAVSIVINYEEGSEHSFSSDGIVEQIGEFPHIDVESRDIGNESAYEYGTRVGIWRILNLLREENVKATFFATARTLELNPIAAKQISRDGHEICDHGYSWRELYGLSKEEERKEISKSIGTIERLTGKKPAGFYAREPSENTIDLVSEFSNFIYDSDCYDDDIPHRYKGSGVLMLPYVPDANDFHFMNPINRFASSGQFEGYLKDAFDVLYTESKKTPRMMSAAFHVRITGRPGRFMALKNFIRYAKTHDDVWIATREEIASYWIREVEPNL